MIVPKTTDTEPLGKYMALEELTPRKGTVTRWWNVRGSNGGLLGQIRWYGAWRCYTFWPDGGAVLNATCLDDLAKFTKARTVEHLSRSQDQHFSQPEDK